ncbi:MAG: DRTGG domain-containing protein [Oscillospiraceae bacterium]|nr:DRTGG domain-containing protein [Oscillospiraceae bacterium]
MNIRQLVEACDLQVLTCPEQTDREITGCYIGDLLSWAMGKVRCGDVWLTVMGNINAIAVSVLADAACIVLVDNAALDQEAAEKAAQQEVVVLRAKQNAYELAIKIAEMLQ